MLPSDSTVCFTTRASSRSKSITPTPTAIPRSTSPPSPCWACASARASVGPAPAHLPDRSQLRLRFACIFGQPRRPDHRHRADRRAMGPHGSTLRVAQNRPRHGVRGLKRLVGFSAKNRFYRANRDLGRIFKTEFILQYLSEPELRRRIRRGLLKVEQLHALARDVFYGRRGRINARELWEQMNTCSCLNLILACIVYWQACEISRVLSECDPIANGIDLSLLEHVSHIEWDNVVLYGQYILDRKLVRHRRRARKGRP